MSEETKKLKKIIEVDKPDKVEIKNCSFKQGVFWDKASVEVIELVAQALLNLTELFTKQGVVVNIGSTVSIGNSKFERKGDKE